MTTTVLIAEDDRAARDSVARALELEGYRVFAVGDGVQALEAFEEHGADLLIVDLMMPNLDGLSVCRRLRENNNKTPILITTARTEVSDRVSGLDAGADDYLPKPFALDELLARIRALLRRIQPPADDKTLTLGTLKMDLAARRSWQGENELDLTKTEFDLLELLVRNSETVLEHSQIYQAIWNYDFGGESKALTVYIGYLRRKLEENGFPRIIHTVRGVGYSARLS